jgi:hypothetical protein
MRQRTGPSAKFSHVYPIDSEIETGENFSARCRIAPFVKTNTREWGDRHSRVKVVD